MEGSCLYVIVLLYADFSIWKSRLKGGEIRMWKTKKFIVLPIVGIVLLVGGTTGVVMAHNGNGGGAQAQARQQALLDRVAAIYNENNSTTPIDPEQLKAAFAQAQSEMRDQAVADRLQKLVDNGKISSEDATALLAWWQAKPDVGLQGLLGRGLGLVMMGGKGIDSSKLESMLNKLVAEGKITDIESAALLKWWSEKPNVTLPGPAEGKGMMGGKGMRGRMMGGGKGFGGGATGCPYPPPDASGGAGATGA